MMGQAGFHELAEHFIVNTVETNPVKRAVQYQVTAVEKDIADIGQNAADFFTLMVTRFTLLTIQIELWMAPCPSSPCCAPKNYYTSQKVAPTAGLCSPLDTKPWQYHQPRSSLKPTRTCCATSPNISSQLSICIPIAMHPANASSCS